MSTVYGLFEHWMKYAHPGPDELAWMQEYAQQGIADRHTLLHHPGDPDRHIYFVTHGLLATLWWDQEGRRRINRFLPPHHVALTRYNLYSNKPILHGIYALRRTRYIRLPMDDFRQLKESYHSASTLAHVLSTRTARQLHIKNQLLLINDPLERYTAFIQDEYMKPLSSITSQVEHADYLNISRSSITRAWKNR